MQGAFNEMADLSDHVLPLYLPVQLSDAPASSRQHAKDDCVALYFQVKILPQLLWVLITALEEGASPLIQQHFEGLTDSTLPLVSLLSDARIVSYSKPKYTHAANTATSPIFSGDSLTIEEFSCTAQK
jgi:hypothetical protein